MPPPPIIAAAQACDKAALKKAIDAGASVQTVGQNGNSPLHLACQKESAASIAVIKLLLECGADPGAENDFGDTPLAAAQAKKFNKLLPMLEEAAAGITHDAELRPSSSSHRSRRRRSAARGSAEDPPSWRLGSA